MDNFKKRMGIMPIIYTAPQIISLDLDTRIALLDKVYYSFSFQKDDKEYETLTEKIWNLVVHLPMDEFEKFNKSNTYVNNPSLSFYNKKDNFYESIIKPYFSREDETIWNVLQLCELVAKYPSSDEIRNCLPNQEILPAPKKPYRGLADFDELSRFRNQEENREYYEKDREYQKQAAQLGEIKAILQNSVEFNNILEIYWVGYRFDEQGNILPCDNNKDKDILEKAFSLATKNKMDSFLEHFLEAIQLAKGKNLDARASARASITALEGLLKQLTNLPLATLGKANTEASKRNLITANIHHKISKLWAESNNNNTRHSASTPQSTSIYEARTLLIAVAYIATEILDNTKES